MAISRHPGPRAGPLPSQRWGRPTIRPFARRARRRSPADARAVL